MDRRKAAGFHVCGFYGIMALTNPGSPGNAEVYMKAAVVYYSRSGVTKKIAEMVQAKFNADMVFVEPEKAYGNFAASIIRVIREKTGKKNPAPKTPPADFSVYDTVFIGFPVWAATVPDFLQEYIRRADLAGKRVIPFATAGNNGRDESLAALKALLPDSEITDYFYTSMKEPADADAWLEGIRE